MLQLSNLLSDYQAYPTSVQFSEVLGKPPLPAITVCNMNPYSSRATKASSKYAAAYAHYYQQHGEPPEPSRFMEHFGTQATLEVGNKKDVLIRACHWSGNGSKVLQTTPCHYKKDIRLSLIPDYLSCYSIDKHDSNSTRPEALTLLLYLDNFADLPGKLLMPLNINNYRTGVLGVKVIIHQPGSAPLPSGGNQLVVGPGLQTFISLGGTHTVRASEPYGYCVRNKTIPVRGTSGKLLVYNSVSCCNLRTKEEIRRRCDCELATPLPKLWKEVPYCNQNVNGSSSTFEANPDCHGGFAKIDFAKLCEGCYSPCEEVQYSFKVSQAKWPDLFHTLSLYEQYIRNTSIESDFVEYDKILTLAKNNNVSEALTKLHSTSLIQDNFIKLTLRMEGDYHTKVTEAPKYSVYNLISSIGGTTSFWIGISWVTFFEIFEMLFEVFLYLCSSEQRTSPTEIGVKEQKGKKDQLAMDSCVTNA